MYGCICQRVLNKHDDEADDETEKSCETTMYGWNVDDEKLLSVNTTSLTGFTETLSNTTTSHLKAPSKHYTAHQPVLQQIKPLTEQGLTSARTQYRLYGWRFLQVWWPNQQCQSTKGGWLVIQTGLSLTMLTSLCYNTTTCMQILYKKII